MTEVRVGTVEDFPAGEFQVMDVDGKEIGLVRQADGTFHAVLNYCPHRGAPICRGFVSGTMLPSNPGELVYGREDQILRCPWHGFEFELETGKSAYTGSRIKLRKFPVEVRDDAVFVKLK